MQYNHKEIEKKWQKNWAENKTNFCDLNDNKRKPFYNLVMFYYPSGDSLHIGHGYNFTGSDVYGRFKRLQGYNVFQPMGSDSFGLPAENYAIKTGIHPEITTKKNRDRYREQLKRLGMMYDWDKEINTSSPEYYKYTQKIFSILYKNGLAYRKKSFVNWCNSCKTVLANEQVIDGCCERCDTEIKQKELKQWFFRITKYADNLIDGLEKIDWPRETKTLQKNWIGRSEGSKIAFRVKNSDDKILVFTTRADTLFGSTYVVLSPEHPLIKKWILEEKIENKEEVKDYIQKSKNKTELERIGNKEKTGVDIKGINVINPANGEEISVFVADYVLVHYGTGAVMAVPAHDDRDFAFAKKYGLVMRQVITDKNKKIKIKDKAFIDYGFLINSGKFNGMETKEAKKAITEFVNGEVTITYRLRDWLISRQRYWGAPIPIIYCDKCGEVLDEKLPVQLPELESYKPADDGQSPLARSGDFINVTCPKCGSKAKRSTETMDTFICSSWYFLKYLSPEGAIFFDKNLEKKWLPVNQYCGGKEHACMHLLYSRFITKVLKDAGYINFDEPFLKLRHQGMILASDGNKMSKSKGNVINPIEIIKTYGADVFRVYILFLAPFEQGGNWTESGIKGADRFLKKVFLLQKKLIIPENGNYKQDTALEALKHQTIRGVTEDIERFHFNTAISKLMIFTNALVSKKEIQLNDYSTLLMLLSPFAPHICEELWESLGNKGGVFMGEWPKYNKKLAIDNKITIVIQVNSRVRDEISIDVGLGKVEVQEISLEREKIKKWIDNHEIKKVIFVKNKLINILI